MKIKKEKSSVRISAIHATKKVWGIFYTTGIFPWLFCLVWLLGACQGPGSGPNGSAPPPVPVQTVTVEPTQIPQTVSAVGSLESPQTTELAAEIGGKVVFLDIPEGQEVKTGHVLARVDYDQAQAAVLIAEARYKNAQKTLERLKTLSARATSQQALDDARAELEAAEGQLADAKTVLRKTTIRAPFTGRLGLRQVSLGAYLNPGTPIVRLTQIKPLDLVFSLPQRYIFQIQQSQTVRGVVGDCEDTFTAQISVIDPYIDPATRSVQIQGIVPNTDGRLLPGMAVAVHVEVANIPAALLIPEEAVIRQGTKRLVYTVSQDGSVDSKEVTLGQFFVNRVQVESGLEAGDIVIAAGHQKLGPGAKVVAQPYELIENPNLELGLDGTIVRCE